MIQANDRVLLVSGDRKYFVKAVARTLGTDRGTLDLAQIIGAEPGSVIMTHLGEPFTILLPRPTDFFAHGKRSGAPMLPRDIGMVIASTGMNRRDTVLDAGTGSGMAAIFFGGIAASVVTCEQRPEFAKLAEENIREAGLENVRVVCGNVLEAEGEYDVVHLDLHLTADHIVHAHGLLKAGGYLAVYTPFLEQTFQAMDTAAGLFAEVACHELIGRELSRSPKGTRPSTRIGHSGFITIARKY
jgi:tRNA (adenine57-N1/adenine58-N1)-methyltransferase